MVMVMTILVVMVAWVVVRERVSVVSAVSVRVSVVSVVSAVSVRVSVVSVRVSVVSECGECGESWARVRGSARVRVGVRGSEG